MSPDDIERVRKVWEAVLADRRNLAAAVAARLPGTADFRAGRASWIVRSVTELTQVLDRPTAFGPVAAELIALRFPVTLEELAGERDALLGALDECFGLGADDQHSWCLAFGLFAEIVCAVGLAPFGCAPASAAPPDPTAAGSVR